MSSVKEISFPSHEDETLTLEGSLWTPDERKCEKVCVLVHPWGVLGGSQANTEPYAEILSSVYGIECVTFNLRGVGRSTGSSTYRCRREIEDAVGACEWVRTNLNRPIVLVGSSAGAAIAGSALDRVPEAIAYIGIGYTFGWISSVMFGSHFDAILSSEKPKLFIMGTTDQFTSVNQLEARLAIMNNVSKHLVMDVGHFDLESRKHAKTSGEVIAKFMKALP